MIVEHVEVPTFARKNIHCLQIMFLKLSADPLGVSEGTFPSLVSFLAYYLYIGQGNVAQFAVDYYLGDPPTVSERGGGKVPSPQLKTDTPIQDSCNGLQKTIGFCNFCFASAIGVPLFG